MPFSVLCRYGGKEGIMNLDKNSIGKLLALDDARLAVVIRQLASSAGISPSSLNLGQSELNAIRQALSMATEGDLSRAAELIKNFKNGNRG